MFGSTLLVVEAFASRFPAWRFGRAEERKIDGGQDIGKE